MIQAKVSDIQKHFASLVGTKLAGYETAELLLQNGQWDPWPDLPIRIYNEMHRMVAVSWSKFDDLWLASDLSLPFSTDATIRWVKNAFPSINSVLGQTIRAVTLGQGEMSIEGRSIEIWTRLLIKLDTRWLEIVNALDENAYEVYDELPEGVFVPCV